jgi:hypothetical protein
VSTTSPVANGQWHLLTFTHDDLGRNDRLYLDGVKEGDNAFGAVVGPISSIGNPPAAYPLTIGRMTTDCSPTRSNSYYSGMIDGLRVWQRPLSGAEVLALYTATRPLYP